MPTKKTSASASKPGTSSADTKKPRGKSGVTRTAVDRVNDPPPATGLTLVERVAETVEREITKIEAIIGGSHIPEAQRTEAERRARTLASLARTLGEVMRLRATERRAKPRDDDIPRDLDEFRRELARRLDGMVPGPAAASAEGDERR